MRRLVQAAAADRLAVHKLKCSDERCPICKPGTEAICSVPSDLVQKGAQNVSRPRGRPRGGQAVKGSSEGSQRVGMGLDEFVGKGFSKKKRRKNPKVLFEKAKNELVEVEQGQRDPKAPHFVALYAKLHEHVYGVAPTELEDVAWFAACKEADRIFNEFQNSKLLMFDFMRWVWRRERAAEKRRKADGVETSRRIGWRLQFSRTLVTDFRVAHA